MVELGYALSSEEFAPDALIDNARRAEEVGFSFALISDHYHPWVTKQGEAPFVWAVIGGISRVTSQLQLGTGVTCPTVRIHPAIIAQAAATSAAMMPGRFFLGVGTGENLNEHIVGKGWPPQQVRLDMLEEAVTVIRGLWEGKQFSHRGDHFIVENAQIYTLPDQLPPLMVAAAGDETGEVAGRIGDGLISTSPNQKVVETFDENGGTGKPRYGQLTVCWAKDEQTAKKQALEIWPNGGMTSGMHSQLPTPAFFDEAIRLVTEDMLAEQIPCGPDPERHKAAIQKFIDAGFDHVYIHQIGPDQDGFFDFYQREIMPAF
ncbi:MAG TPA: TIGR03557 family F420-dependent LLM class oxidoreductase [Thermomicrobiales bacterium]|nr:TIGR03557 family F420-dependent LLM class oxidoreductase [Thermomicrobiales bacterium]